MKDVVTMKKELKKLIDTAAGRVPADLVIKNCKIVNVFSGKIQEGDIAFSGNQIAGIGVYEESATEKDEADGKSETPFRKIKICLSKIKNFLEEEDDEEDSDEDLSNECEVIPFKGKEDSDEK